MSEAQPSTWADRPTVVLAGLGAVADVAAVAQLVTSGSREGILVAGLLAVLSGVIGLIVLSGRPLGVPGFVMIALIVSGAGVAGAMIEKILNEPAAAAASAPVTPGKPLREGEATLKDQDYLDAETGMIGEVRPNASDVWYVSPYRSLWTAGGGALPITAVEGVPDSAACADALAVRDYALVEVGTMKAGGWACARTAEDNLLAIQIREVPEGDEPLRISYVVWRV
ncbi:hypothetical protein [Herbidospora cretacea]|uniref:hypothetical protein n=1 Tax=Herbidospora cretacea TaxID=28444 RepID=UPI0004C3B240|nr:hypothetical protein [Herbidospora cretacea]